MEVQNLDTSADVSADPLIDHSALTGVTPRHHNSLYFLEHDNSQMLYLRNQMERLDPNYQAPMIKVVANDRTANLSKLLDISHITKNTYL